MNWASLSYELRLFPSLFPFHASLRLAVPSTASVVWQYRRVCQWVFSPPLLIVEVLDGDYATRMCRLGAGFGDLGLDNNFPQTRWAGLSEGAEKFG